LLGILKISRPCVSSIQARYLISTLVLLLELLVKTDDLASEPSVQQLVIHKTKEANNKPQKNLFNFHIRKIN
jgi:hypothetical protein